MCLQGEGHILGHWSRNTGVADAKSQFNKEKYLPLARDLPSKISHLCCNEMKKKPLHKWQTKQKVKPILATMAEESRVRKQSWLRNGCNAYDGYKAKSQPMSFWTEQDVLQYIVENNIDICSVYGDIVTTDQDGMEYAAPPMTIGCGRLKCTGCKRTGCIFCGFGFHLDKGKTRFQLLSETHPKQYDYCMRGGAMD